MRSARYSRYHHRNSPSVSLALAAGNDGERDRRRETSSVGGQEGRRSPLIPVLRTTCHVCNPNVLYMTVATRRVIVRLTVGTAWSV